MSLFPPKIFPNGSVGWCVGIHPAVHLLLFLAVFAAVAPQVFILDKVFLQLQTSNKACLSPNVFRAFKLFCPANAGTKANQRNALGAQKAAATQKHFI